MKVLNLILAAMFLLFAFVQLNDPDPVTWILIYGAMAAVCILAAFRYQTKTFKIGLIVLLLSLGAYSLIYLGGMREWMAQEDKSVLFDDIAKMQYPYIEEAREFLGILICIIVLIVQLVATRKPQMA